MIISPKSRNANDAAKLGAGMCNSCAPPRPPPADNKRRHDVTAMAPAHCRERPPFLARRARSAFSCYSVTACSGSGCRGPERMPHAHNAEPPPTPMIRPRRYVDYNPPYTNTSVAERVGGSGQPCLWCVHVAPRALLSPEPGQNQDLRLLCVTFGFC